MAPRGFGPQGRGLAPGTHRAHPTLGTRAAAGPHTGTDGRRPGVSTLPRAGRREPGSVHRLTSLWEIAKMTRFPSENAWDFSLWRVIS